MLNSVVLFIKKMYFKCIQHIVTAVGNIHDCEPGSSSLF